MSSEVDTPVVAAAARPNKAGKPQVQLVEVASPARPARLRRRHRLAIVSFLLVVFLPVVAMAVYLYVFAADQYASTVGFFVRKEETSSAMEILGGLSTLSSASSSDTDILYKFIHSQKMVIDVDEKLDLRSMFTVPTDDPVFSLPKDASIEDLLAYWKRMVRIYYDPSVGLMEVEARAFRPKDAQRLAQAVFDRSALRINELSAVARADTTRYAEDELNTAVDRLKKARKALTAYRNKTQIVDPTADVQGQMGLLSSLNAELATALIDLDILLETAGEDDPRLGIMRRRVSVIETRISEERQKLGVGDNPEGGGYAELVDQFESLKVDLEFAQKAYITALSAYDTAVAEARRRSRYLAAYLEPTLAQTSAYPQRLVILIVGGFVIFGFWAIGLLTYYSLKDRH